MARAITMQDFAMSAAPKQRAMIVPLEYAGAVVDFLDMVDDEDANWANRGSLLASYRRLKAVLAQPHFGVIELHHCGHATKPRPAQPASPNEYI